jgi:FkbM family methyltransferase
MSNYLLGIRAILSLIRKSRRGPFLHAWNLTRFDQVFSASFSQGGEDLALLHLLEKEVGKYLDIGAHHPDRFSNTRLLYDSGWSGINVEANPNLIAEFKKKRPRDITICACVGSQDEYLFNIFEEPALSTANLDWKKKFLDEGQRVESEIRVTGISLYELITKHFPSGDLDLLLVDAEGSDFDVIQSGNFENLPVGLFPKWILVETPRPLSKALQEETVKYLQGFDYEPILILPMSTILKQI